MLSWLTPGNLGAWPTNNSWREATDERGWCCIGEVSHGLMCSPIRNGR